MHLHHLWEEQRFTGGVLTYAMVFFAIFNAWINFTWFASAFDTDDWLYRLTTFVGMARALTIAAGAQRAMLDNDFRAIVVGYVIMRVAMAAQWTRAAISDPHTGAPASATPWASSRRSRCGWPGRCSAARCGFSWSWRRWTCRSRRSPNITAASPSPPPHRRALAACSPLIVLGESILAVANSIIGSLSDSHERTGLIGIAACALVVVASMWWIYFDRPQHDQTVSKAAAFFWGYLHYFIFARRRRSRPGWRWPSRNAPAREPPAPHGGRPDADHPLAVFVVATWLALDAVRRDASRPPVRRCWRWPCWPARYCPTRCRVRRR